ncbi:MAG: hypothetical protein PSV24_00005, partial [Rhodoferax sp.]|nr:hypothetical protein [Rhodoferax sp.]
MSFRWLPKGLQAQLMLLTAAAVLIAVVLAGTFTMRQQLAFSRSGIELQALALVRNLAVSSASPLAQDSLDQLDSLLERSVIFPDVLELRLTDARGTVLSHFLKSAQDQ